MIQEIRREYKDGEETGWVATLKDDVDTQDCAEPYIIYNLTPSSNKNAWRHVFFSPTDLDMLVNMWQEMKIKKGI